MKVAAITRLRDKSGADREITEAFAVLDKAAMLEASDADIYIIRGNLYESMERFDEALEVYRQVLG